MNKFLELQNNEYYTLETIINEKKQIIIYIEMVDAISRIHQYIQEDVPSNQITLTHITIHPQQLKARVISWSIIATELIKGLKK